MPPSMTSDMSSSSPSSDASSIRLSSSSPSLGLDDVLVLLDRDLVLGLLELGLGLQLGLGHRLGAGLGGHGPDRGRGPAAAVEDLEVEHGAAGGAERSGSGRSRKSGRRSSGRSASCPIPAWPKQSPGGRCKGEARNCHVRPELSKANSVARARLPSPLSAGRSPGHVVARGAARRSFRCGAGAGRQVDLAPFADAGGHGRGREPDRRPARGRGRAGDRRGAARHGRRGRARPDPAAGASGASASAGSPSPRTCSTWAMPAPAPGC